MNCYYLGSVDLDTYTKPETRKQNDEQRSTAGGEKSTGFGLERQNAEGGKIPQRKVQEGLEEKPVTKYKALYRSAAILHCKRALRFKTSFM